MSFSQRSEALQWKAEFRFSSSERTYDCEIYIGPFPNSRELVIWRNEFIRDLISFCKLRKGIRIFLCREKTEEFQKTETLPLAFKEPRQVARNFMICASRKLMHLVESQAA